MPTEILDSIAAGEQDALPGQQFLDLMLQRRTEFWADKPHTEKTHYQGFSNEKEHVLHERMRIQCHAELAAGNIPLAMLEYIPWMDLKADFARQVHDEFVHFKLTRDYYHETFGGEYPLDYQPGFTEWKDLLSLAHTGDYQIDADPATRVIGRSVILQFAIEGWDVEYVHPHFMKEIEYTSPALFEIFETRVIPDEHLHAENGLRVLLKCDGDRRLQKLAIRNLDTALEYHWRANIAYRNHFNSLAETPASVTSPSRPGQACTSGTRGHHVQ